MQINFKPAQILVDYAKAGKKFYGEWVLEFRFNFYELFRLTTNPRRSYRKYLYLYCVKSIL